MKWSYTQALSNPRASASFQVASRSSQVVFWFGVWMPKRTGGSAARPREPSRAARSKAAAVLACSVGTASGAYLVELRGGDRLTVDSYWEDGDRTHLVRGGVDMIVPKSRVRGIREVEGEALAAPPAARATRGVSPS